MVRLVSNSQPQVKTRSWDAGDAQLPNRMCSSSLVVFYSPKNGRGPLRAWWACLSKYQTPKSFAESDLFRQREKKEKEIDRESSSQDVMEGDPEMESAWMWGKGTFNLCVIPAHSSFLSYERSSFKLPLE